MAEGSHGHKVLPPTRGRLHAIVMLFNDNIVLFSPGFGLEACFLLGVGFTRDTVTAIACLTVAVGFSGFAISGELDRQ